jgi:hypothetical protein
MTEATGRISATAPPASHMVVQAVPSRDGWIGRLIPPPDPPSLWLWMCEHTHPSDWEALECAETKRWQFSDAEGSAT